MPNEHKIYHDAKQAYEGYIHARNKVLRRLGQDLAAKMPIFYGKVTFNIQNGRFVNANLREEPMDGLTIEESVK